MSTPLRSCVRQSVERALIYFKVDPLSQFPVDYKACTTDRNKHGANFEENFEVDRAERPRPDSSV